ncbi:MAG TPA: efflux RND transporter permease subunit, partial [Spirochaetota bacterium]|nr:efflux RND transporter permease subunit [Spirochaetota bacterium]
MIINHIFNNRIGFLLVILLGIIIGIVCITLLPIKLYPDMKKPWLQVSIPAPGYTATDFRDEYGDTIETALSSIKEVELIESTYSSGSVSFRLEFKWNMLFDDAKQLAINAMETVKNKLPEDSQKYSVGTWRSDTAYMSIAAYSTEEKDPTRIYKMVEPVLKLKLKDIEDAESIDILNVEELTASITLKEESLLDYGLSVDNVLNVIRSGYKNISLGSFSDGRNQFNLRIKKDIDTLFDIEKIIITNFGSKKIYLKDIAYVEVKYGLARTAFRYNGNRAVMIFATPKVDGNLKNMSEDIKKVLKDAKKYLPEHIRFDYIVDPAVFIDKAINNVINSALLGSLLAFIVIMFFMGEIKNSILIFISIPVSVIFSFILMKIFNVTINLISLGGMTLAVGMIVDASIVVMENIHRHKHEALQKHHTHNFIDIIKKSVNEIQIPVISSTLTSVCVFLPLSFTSPLTNGILGDLARTVVYTLLCSMFIALFFIPIIALYLFRKKNNEIQKEKDTIFHKFSDVVVNWLTHGYSFLLKKLLKSRVASIIFILFSFVLLTFLITFIFPKITKEILATPKSDSINLRFFHYIERDQEKLSDIIAPIEKDIMTSYQGKVKSLFVRINRNGRGGMIISLNSSKYLDEVLESLKTKYQTNNDMEFDVASWDPSSLPLPRTYSLHIRVTGKDREKILSLMEQIYDLIRKENIYRNAWTSPVTRLSNEIILVPRYEILDTFSEFNLSRVANTIRLFLNGGSAVSMSVDGQELTVYMKYPDNSVKSVKDIENYLLPFNNKTIPIKHFFDIKKTRGINQIRLDDGEETFNIFAVMKIDDPA